MEHLENHKMKINFKNLYVIKNFRKDQYLAT